LDGAFEATYIGVPAFFAAPVAPIGNALPSRFVAAIEFHLVQQLFTRRKELGLLSFFKELLVFLASVSQKQAAASGNLEGAGGMLVWTDSAQKPKADPRTRKCSRVVIRINLSALVSTGQKLVTMEAEPILPRKLPQNNVSARRPLAVPQELPVSTPNLEVYTSSDDSVQKTLASRFPSTQEANGTLPTSVFRG
jgi:hypothetical protein